MTPQQLRTLLEDVARGEIDASRAHERLTQYLRQAPFEDLGFARIDHHRPMRQGIPEVVFGTGKTPEQIALIAERIVAAGHSLLVTRATEAAYDAVRRALPDATFHPVARIIALPHGTPPRGRGTILVVSAGTSDLPVAEEAVLTAELLGNQVDRLCDVGVAGLHRVLAENARLASARVIIVVAGMEGALASVVGGLVSVPVIAVPTSVGYGASLGGLAALLAMLNSCVPGVAVVNIDNGFGAAAMANLINHLE